MFCTECICHECPYGLKCYICDRELDGHILISEGCNGHRISNTCPLEDFGAKHASALREIIKAKDRVAMENYFDRKTGAWYNS